MTRRHLAMVGVAALVVLLAWFTLLWSPKGADLAAAKERRSTAVSQVDQLQARLDRLQAARRDEPRLRAASDRLTAAVPATADLAGFVLATNDAAAKAGVDFLSVVPAPATPSTTGGPAEVHVSLTVKGTYAQVLGFMDRLLDLPRVVVLDSVGVTAETAPGGSPPLQVSLTGRIFTTQAPPVPGAAATTAAAGTPTTAPATTTAPASLNSMVP